MRQTNRRGSPAILRLYLRDINGHALLTAEEECSLAEAIARGDSEARTQMIQANLRLVVRIARGYRGRGIALDDLIGEGNLGLIRATQDFNPRFGTRFSTYASFWIKQAISHALMTTTSTIRLPTRVARLLTKWWQAERALSRKRGSAPTFEEVAAYLHLTEARSSVVARACQASQLRLQNTVTLEADRWTPHELSGQRKAPEASPKAKDERTTVLRQTDRPGIERGLGIAVRVGRRAAGHGERDRARAWSKPHVRADFTLT